MLSGLQPDSSFCSPKLTRNFLRGEVVSDQSHELDYFFRRPALTMVGPISRHVFLKELSFLT